MCPQKFPGGFAPRPHRLSAPPINLLVCNFLQWFNILHKILWNPGPMIFVIHLIFAIHIVSGPCNALHSINCFQRQFLQKLIKLYIYPIYIFLEIRFLPTAFWKKSKIWLCLRHSRGCNCKIFWGSMPPDPPRLMRLWRMRVAASPVSQPLVHTDH